jgi:predicted DNA-binding transcriptional regulator AlpA
MSVSTNSFPKEGYVRLPQVLSVIPISKSSWWAGIRSGKYPRQIKLGEKTSVWRAEEIWSLIENGGNRD